MRVPITLGETFRYGAPEVLFGGPFAADDATFGGTNWDVHPDGQRFVLISAGGNDASAATPTGVDMRLEVNWFSELRAAEGR